jgi:hypothetical protein
MNTPTAYAIREMAAGPELDHLYAIHVLGWTLSASGPWKYENSCSGPPPVSTSPDVATTEMENWARSGGIGMLRFGNIWTCTLLIDNPEWPGIRTQGKTWMHAFTIAMIVAALGTKP